MKKAPAPEPEKPLSEEVEEQLGVLETMHRAFVARIRARKEQGPSEAPPPRAPRGESA
jgi:hypothetical protein